MKNMKIKDRRRLGSKTKYLKFLPINQGVRIGKPKIGNG